MTTTPADKSWWAARITPQPLPAETPAVAEILHQTSSGAAAFQARLEDGRTVWVKALGNPQGDQVLTTEWVCSQTGRALGFSVAESLIVHLPEPFHHHPLGDPRGHRMRSGPAYATLHLPHAVEINSLRHEKNPDTQSGLAALWEIFLGGDEQWLATPHPHPRLVSFDHSLWLTRGEGDWDATLLHRLADHFWAPPGQPASSHQQVLQALQAISAEEILAILNQVPLQWKTSNQDLAALGWFTSHRIHRLARRMEAAQ